MTRQSGIHRALGMAAAAALFLCAAYGQMTFRRFYDGNGQLFRVLDASGNLVEYDYDAAGNAIQIRRSVVPAGALSILNIVPQRGNANATVTIYGQNFSSVAAGNTVMFNGVAATVISASATAVVVQVPIGATTGPVSLTVNGNTVTSGTLLFTVPGLLTITSMSPAVGFNGETVTVNVQGANLTNASFAFLGAGGIGVSNVNVASSTQASFTANIGQVGGNFVLVGANDFGASSSVPSGANTFHVYFPPGDNYALTTLSVFNTYIPPGTVPGVPAGSNMAEQTLSVFNTYLQPGTVPGVPAGSNMAEQTLSVFNTSIPAGTTPGVPAGSNAAFQLFSTDNTATGVPPTPTLSIALLSMSPTLHSAAANVSTLVVGQTVEIDIASPAGFLPVLQFRVNGEVLASSSIGYLKTYFTVPYGANSLTFQAAAQTGYGEEFDSAPAQISVTPDRGLTIAGRVVDGGGRPVPSAPLTWQANGLTAEYFQFNRQLSGIPDLAGLQPTRTASISALNYPNPQQVFGQDPMGVGLGQNYAARFSGKLSIAVEGDYQFQLNAHLGAQLSIDGVAVTDSSGAVVSTALTAGLHDIEAIYYESGGTAALQLLWTPPGGTPGVIPPAVLSTVAATANAGADGRFQVLVPAALSGFQVSIANGQGSVLLDQ